MSWWPRIWEEAVDAEEGRRGGFVEGREKGRRRFAAGEVREI
jgi:hypothetical protein